MAHWNGNIINSNLEQAERSTDSVNERDDDEIVRCETQMINTYTRQEVRDPETNCVEKVLHAFSFCNHANLPDYVLEETVREKWKDLFALTGVKDSALVDEWPGKIVVTNDPVPGIENLFQPSGSKDSCIYCNMAGLKALTKHRLNKELENEIPNGKPDEN